MSKDVVKHYGIKERSGRYPFGSGGNAEQRGTTFLEYVKRLEKSGMSETEVAKGVGMNTTQLRQRKTLAKAEKRKSDYAQALRLQEKGVSKTEIGRRMNMNESSVRSLLNPATQRRSNITEATSKMLKDAVKDKKYVDIGLGAEAHIGISRNRLKTAVRSLEDEGYTKHYVNVTQLGTGKQTSITVLAAPEVPWKTVYDNRYDIKTITDYTQNGGETYLGLKPVTNISSKKVAIRYAEDGGSNKDGVIELRRGVEELSLGNARYAQVRIGVDGKKYLKGMAVYGDNMPDGVDIVFNTNKKKDVPKDKVLKSMKVVAETGEIDADNPFGSTIRQKTYIDKNGKEKVSALNIVYEEGEWGEWSKTLSSQMLSKQRPPVAKVQLDLAYDIRKSELDSIMAVTNPSVKKALLDKFADGADSAAVHLKAAALPRQGTHVILPFDKMKDDEIYAPNYRDGEMVALVRFPHGGTFEIPELKVNNKFKDAKDSIPQAADAVGINARVAERLSGADFDGDTVLVIPTKGVQLNITSPLEGLKNFDPQSAYPAYEGMPKLSSRDKEIKMGSVSNLITDMTIKGANTDDLAAAVRHSMVIIDAEKHNLNHKQSYKDNNISNLKATYQGGSRNGASTIVSRASSEKRVVTRKDKGIDPKTGKKLYEEVVETYVNKDGKTVTKTEKSTKMYETDDAFTLTSGPGNKAGTMIEKVYATHANKLKALANEARKESYVTKPLPYSPSAKKVYVNEVASLNAKLNQAIKNKPLERQAQLLANSVVSSKKDSNPDMTPADLKKIKGQALDASRKRVGAGKDNIVISPKEWDAIQAGAISGSKLGSILNNSDIDVVKQLATPRTKILMSQSKVTKANQLLSKGYTQAQVADAIGVSLSTLKEGI